MTNNSTEAQIVNARREAKQILAKLKTNLQKDIEAFCLETVGHRFSNWQYEPEAALSRVIVYTHHRTCELCRRVEHKTEFKND